MKKVYLLEHVHEISEDNEDVKLIGIYSSKKRALSILEKYKKIEGFKDSPEGFIIDEYTIDEDHWTEGFVTLPC